MTQLPPDELAALPDDIEPGTTVLELGNKKNSTGLYRDWYLDQGLLYECVDWNGLDGAWKFDMRIQGEWQEIIDVVNDGERFEVVTNFGFTEHVGETLYEQIECWRNVHRLIAENGALAICMPLMPFWKGHGRWMPTPNWYCEFAELNGYKVLREEIWDRVRPTFSATFRKLEYQDTFILPVHSEIRRSDL